MSTERHTDAFRSRFFFGSDRTRIIVVEKHAQASWSVHCFLIFANTNHLFCELTKNNIKYAHEHNNEQAKKGVRRSGAHMQISAPSKENYPQKRTNVLVSFFFIFVFRLIGWSWRRTRFLLPAENSYRIRGMSSLAERKKWERERETLLAGLVIAPNKDELTKENKTPIIHGQRWPVETKRNETID